MMGFIKILQKRPTDKTIRLLRIIFGLALILTTYYSLIYTGNREIQDSLFGQNLTENGKNITKYIIVSLGILPLFMGVTNLCLLKSKYIRIAQIIFGITLFYVASIIKTSPDLGVDTLLGVVGIIPLVGGITGKLITKSCLRYGQKITKIRV